MQQKSNRSFRLRDGDVERLRRNFRRRLFRLDEDVADLRAVSVHDDHVKTAHDQLRQPARRLFGARNLLLVRSSILGPQQRVAAEGDDGEFCAFCHWRSTIA